jgi:FkbM family methyltransferase
MHGSLETPSPALPLKNHNNRCRCEVILFELGAPVEIPVIDLLKNYVLRTVHAAGYDLVRRNDINDRDFTVHIQQLFTLLDIDCVLDVGANVGQYRDFLRNRVGYKGLIISFEPIAANVEKLKRRSLSDDEWQVEGYALGSEPGDRSFNVMRSTIFSSFLEPDHSNVPDLSGENDLDHVEEVEVKTLESVLPDLRSQFNFHRPYLKIDTQGHDVEVLRGGENVLPSISALQTEASVVSIYKKMPSYLDTMRFLSERGFDVTALHPVNRDRQLRLIEFDCVMRNRTAPSCQPSV